jgi:hypothetical protein
MDRHFLDTDTGSGWLASAYLPSEAAQETTAALKREQKALRRSKGRVATPSSRMAALHAAWIAHTVKQAIAAVGSASDEDYRAFGWERGQLLAQLQWLRAEKERGPMRRIPLAVTVSCSDRPHRLAAEIKASIHCQQRGENAHACSRRMT